MAKNRADALSLGVGPWEEQAKHLSENDLFRQRPLFQTCLAIRAASSCAMPGTKLQRQQSTNQCSISIRSKAILEEEEEEEIVTWCFTPGHPEEEEEVVSIVVK